MSCEHTDTKLVGHTAIRSCILAASILNDYKDILSACPGLSFQEIDESCNCSYFPVVFESEDMLLKVDSALKANNIFARRYFWPSVNTYKAICPDAAQCLVSEEIANRVLCLPLYCSLSHENVVTIAENVKEIIYQ